MSYDAQHSRVHHTVNGRRYAQANCRMKLAPHGRPVAIRRVVTLQQGGTAGHRYQIITPADVRAVSPGRMSDLLSMCHALN